LSAFERHSDGVEFPGKANEERSFEVAHWIPGRVRFRIPRLTRSNAPIGSVVSHLSQIKGVIDVRANRYCGSVVVTFDRTKPGLLEVIMSELDALDFTALVSSPAVSDSPDREKTSQVASQASWLEWVGAQGWHLLSIASAGVVFSLFPGPLFTGGAICLCGAAAVPSFRRASMVLCREGRLNVDFLDSLAICVSTLHGNIFTTAFMTWLITLGDWIREQTAARSMRAIGELLNFQNRRAWVCRDGETISLPVSEIVVGDTVVVYDGDLIPIDGRVLKGRATVDQRAITGESVPANKGRNDFVYASTALQEGKLYLRAERKACESLVAQIVHALESSPVGETRMQNYAEVFADRLVAPSLGLSGLLYMATHDANRALAALIVDFGTGIRVAAPTAVLASISAAAARGVVVRGGSTMERLAQVDTVVFDKTGTLTIGEPKITEVISYRERHFPPRKVLEIAAAAELRLKHPVAIATVAMARRARIQIPARQKSRYRIGLGIEASVNSYKVHVGSERYFRDLHININGALRNCRRVDVDGKSSLMVAVDGDIVGQLVYEDQIRTESASVIGRLKERNISELAILTGDNPAAARQVAARLGIKQFHAGILPAEKAEIVRAMRKSGRTVAMVGDGINDAVALSSADVGIAMKNGADIARQSADVVLAQDDLAKVVTAIDVARDAIGLIHQNYSIVVSMNLLALAAAVFGAPVSPEMIALVSNGSAVAASINGLRPLID
jgi:heavy metal translocating P-type ATPase